MNLSSENLLSSVDISMSLSKSCCLLYTCSARSQLSGHYFASYRCLLKRELSSSEVSPTYTTLHTLHRAAYTMLLVLQSPQAAILIGFPVAPLIIVLS